MNESVFDNFLVRIDKKSRIPLYIQLSDQIRSGINEGTLQVSNQLPSETKISRNLGLSPMTVRQALQELVSEGILRRERGKGTFVKHPPQPHQLDRLTSFSEEMTAQGRTAGAKILECIYRAAPENIAEKLNITTGDLALFIKRMRFSDGVVVGLHETWLPQTVTITREELESQSSLYALLEKKGHQIGESEETLVSVAASRSIASLLDLKNREPILQVSRRTMDKQKNVIEYVIAHYRGDLYEYSVKLHR